MSCVRCGRSPSGWRERGASASASTLPAATPSSPAAPFRRCACSSAAIRSYRRSSRTSSMSFVKRVRSPHRSCDACFYALLDRRFPLRRPPRPSEARRQLVELVLGAAGEVSVADVAAALPLTRREAERELELITENGRALRLDETLYAPAR